MLSGSNHLLSSFSVFCLPIEYCKTFPKNMLLLYLKKNNLFKAIKTLGKLSHICSPFLPTFGFPSWSHKPHKFTPLFGHGHLMRCCISSTGTHEGLKGDQQQRCLQKDPESCNTPAATLEEGCINGVYSWRLVQKDVFYKELIQWKWLSC